MVRSFFYAPVSRIGNLFSNYIVPKFVEWAPASFPLVSPLLLAQFTKNHFHKNNTDVSIDINLYNLI